MTLDEYRKINKKAIPKNSSTNSILSLEEYHEIAKNNPSKRSKYGAKPKEVDGIKFHSTWEADRYSELKTLVRIGEIENLCLQVKYELHVNEELICNYIADFVYVDGNGERIVEDAKGVKTPEYKLKKKLMKAIYDIDIYESYRKK